jgi:hypothetical protein
MNAHSQFPPLTRRVVEGQMLSRCMGDPDAVFARLNGPAVHYRIGGCPRWLDVSAKAFIIAAGIVSVAIWVAF